MNRSRAKRTALVMGGSRGIGAAIVKRLVQGGYRVAFTYVHSERRAEVLVEEITKSGGEARAYRVDNREPQAVRRVIDEVAVTFSSLDALVNNAGIGILKPLHDLTLGDFDALVASNVRPVFVALQAASAKLPDGGRIVTVGSVNAERVPAPGMSLYAMSKSALVGLTKGAARDLGPRGITVNLIQPGPTDTEMNPAHGPFAEGQRALLANGRFGKPEEIAGLVSYLLSSEGAFVTGAVLTIDGGYTV